MAKTAKSALARSRHPAQVYRSLASNPALLARKNGSNETVVHVVVSVGILMYF